MQRPFKLYTDASGYAIGAVTTQMDDDNNEYVTQYESRLLKGAEIHYGITEKECLAVIFGVKQNRIYLYGTKFTIVTDHIALNWLMNIKDPTGRLARWAIYLQAYDFDIVHRKGIKHSNADTLSRPVLNTSIIPNIEEKTNLDIIEDEPLLYYLRTGKYMPGASQKQIKRLNRDALYYKCDENGIWFRNNTVDRMYLKVPTKEERPEIIRNAHLLGHFQKFSTYNRLREKYYWKNMLKDIAEIISLCDVCQRNQKETSIHHPAMAINVNGINDMIGIDLVFGLNETIEGYTGILVIIEYLSKTPFVKPIKTKSAEEVADILMEYISIYGPPKVIVTDQGCEFNNKLINNITNAIGVEHRVTASYNPRTNGTCERFNQTFIESLRKHAEKNQANWHKWIPFILIAYKTRVHSTTGYTPFQLMFGRKMNSFEEQNVLLPSEKVELEQRTLEIKNMFDKHEEARTNIQEKQIEQMKNQNDAHKVSDEAIPTGTSVLIKNDGINNKLDPKFKGPYVIVSKDKNQNYKLKDAIGNETNEKIPRHKLKVINNKSSDNVYEIEKILAHKDEKNKRMYLVKWKGYNETTWEPESHFNNMKVINDYLNRKSEKKRGRPRKILNFIGILNLIMLLNTCFAQNIDYTINVNLDYCTSLTETQPIDFENLCVMKSELKYKGPFDELLAKESYSTDTKEKGFSIRHWLKLDVYSKLQQNILGKGHECKKTRIRWKFEEALFGEKYRSSIAETVVLKPSDCLAMVESRICHENLPMNCDGEFCSVEEIVKEEFSWWKEIKKDTYNCKLSPKVITAEKVDDHLFGTNCKASDLSCQLVDSILIWNTDIIHECPLKLIRKNVVFTLDATSKFAYDNELNRFSNSSIISNEELNWDFQVTKPIMICNTIFFETTEGILLTGDFSLKNKINTKFTEDKI